MVQFARARTQLVLAIGCVAATLAGLASASVVDVMGTRGEHRGGANFSVASTASAEARQILPAVYSRRFKDTYVLPPLSELEQAERLRQNQPDGPVTTPHTDGATTTSRIDRKRLGGVPVLDIQPAKIIDPRKVIVHFHGGAFVSGSAERALPRALRLAETAGLRLVSIDYSTTPGARWRSITAQGLDVVQALIAMGHGPADIALLGESAGGNLAIVTALKLREATGQQLAAVVVWSPWVDLSGAGETRMTLSTEEMLLNAALVLKPAAMLYADSADWRHPHVSPIYANFKSGFPPILIQAGTREILLSDAVRLYRAIDQAGGLSILDIYEGMPHVFQTYGALPEAQQAVEKSLQFLTRHLALGQRP
jgi:epsilon-lactone hydrolase